MILPAAFLALFFVLWGFFHLAGPSLEQLLARLARRTAALRYGDYTTVVILLAVGIVVAAMVGDQFVDLAELVHSKSSTLESTDTRVHAWAAHERTAGSTFFFTAMTMLGSPITLAAIVALLSAWLVWKKHWRWAVYLVVTGPAGGLLNLELKRYFARARPDLAEALRHAHGYSFPSGHAMGSMVVFGSIGYVLFRLLETWRTRAAALAAIGTLIAAIAFSRVYLGVHWISDVGGGLAAGFVWLIAATVAYETFRRIRRVRALRRSAE